MTRKPAFGPRWLITGRLRLTSELHLGTGESRPDDALRGPRMTEDETPDIALVAGSDTGRHYIPGTSLKGALRAWINRHLAQLAPDGLITDDWQKDVFGHVTTRSDRSGEEDNGLGGRVIIGDAEVSATQTIQPAREARIAIDPRTRTVDGRRLFHQQTLPPGTVFNIRVVIETPPAEDGRQLVPSAEIAQALLTAFAGFDTGPEETRIRLGADKGMGKGAAVFELGEVRCYDAEVIAEWVRVLRQRQDEAQQSQKRCPDPVPLPRWDEDPASAASASSKAALALQSLDWPEAQPLHPVGRISIVAELQIDTRFLIANPDPRRARKHAEARKRGEEVEPLVLELRRIGETEHPALAATSLKGALRARAAKILKTIHAGDTAVAVWPPEAAEIVDLIFGTTGHRGRLHISAPEPAGAARLVTQEFVALDRFGGGAATQRKFKIRSAEEGGWRVGLSIDLDGLDGDRALACLTLLILTLKDLVEGDITLGHGAARGYGQVSGRLADLAVTPPQEDVPAFWADLVLAAGMGRDPLASEQVRRVIRDGCTRLHLLRHSQTGV